MAYQTSKEHENQIQELRSCLQREFCLHLHSNYHASYRALERIANVLQIHLPSYPERVHNEQSPHGLRTLERAGRTGDIQD